jgi:PPK2 family polyphosphate:nucleotide phosphotransferase
MSKRKRHDLEGDDDALVHDDGTVEPQAWSRVDQLLDRHCLVKPGRHVHLDEVDPAYLRESVLRKLTDKELKSRAQAMLADNVRQLADAQELLYANDRHSMLIVFQAMDAAGKDGTIKHVMSGINPAGCRVWSFKAPNKAELDHNWLWRIWRSVPERGQICIFNRSHYEDVLVTRVHPEYLDSQQLPPGKRGKRFWQQRLDDIVAFERHLAVNGTVILKFFLHVSKDEQRRRFLERLEDRAKTWKFSHADLVERGYWYDYMRVYEKAISATSTEEAPWFVVPADAKWVTRVLVARAVTRAIEALRLKPPTLSDEDQARVAAAKESLLAE